MRRTLHRLDPAVAALVAAAAAAYGTFSVLNHLHYRTNSFDLAIFDQAIWHYSRFEAPHSTVLAPFGYENFLGDHFHPILVALTPLYWIWADPRMLLIAQAILIAVSIVPVFEFCRRRLGRGPGLLLGGAYASFWGIHSALAFDFHEVAFAPLLVALMILAIDDRRFGRYFLLLGLLLLVKENMAVLAAFFGLYLVVLREYRRGAVTVAVGLVWFAVITELVMPLFVDGNPYRHWLYGAVGDDPLDALANMASDPTLVFRVFFGEAEKVETLLYLFAPLLGLVLLSPLALLLVPLLLERMLSANPYLWSTLLHYSLTIAPILVMGAADGIRRLVTRLDGRVARRPRTLATACAATILIANVAVAARFPLTALLDPGFYTSSTEDDVRRAALALIPPDASVTAGSTLVPHLSRRPQAYQLLARTPRTEYVVTDPAEYFSSRWPRAGYVDRRRLLLDTRVRYTPIFERDGIVVLRRNRDHATGSAGGRNAGRS